MKRIVAQRPIIDMELHNFIFKDRITTLEAIFRHLDGYEFSILPEIADEPRWVGNKIDLTDLARFDNPHVFCEPVSWQPK